VFKPAELTAAAEDMLMDIRNDRRLKIRYSDTDMASFWLCDRSNPSLQTRWMKHFLYLQCNCIRLASLL
jgi:hypothetical protein